MGRIKVLITLSLFALVLLAPSIAHAESVSLQPTRDTYIDSALPNSSYGTIGLGTVSHHPSAGNRMVLMHFDMSSIPAGSTITSAVLTMRMGGCINGDAGSGNINSSLYQNNGSPAWTESSTYEQLSTSGSSLDDFAATVIGCNPGGYVDFDMMVFVPYIVDGMAPNDGLVLKPVSGGEYWTRVFYMREAAASSRPTLKITYDVPYEAVESPDGAPIDSPDGGSTGGGSVGNSVIADKPGEPLAPDDSIAAVASLTASQQNDSTDTIELKWAASTTADIQHYRIYRKVAGEAVYTKLAEVSSSETSYKDTKIKPGAQHSYLVRAVRNDKESQNSPVAAIIANTANTPSQNVTITNSTQGYMVGLLALLGLLLGAVIIAYIVLHKKHAKLKTKHAEHVKKTQSNKP